MKNRVVYVSRVFVSRAPRGRLARGGEGAREQISATPREATPTLVLSRD